MKLLNDELVAPLVGAWIEITIPACTDNGIKSLPLWERGLKSIKSHHLPGYALVAPLVGAWIEIEEDIEKLAYLLSLPLWERGLK